MIAAEIFEPIDHASVVDTVVGKVETMIVDGVLKDGARLPSEREMADAFGVSRPKLREALQTLEARGLVHVRHGDGTYIAELTGRAMSPASTPGTKATTRTTIVIAAAMKEPGRS